MAKSSRYRSADTGKFVTKKYADKHPKTTVKETVKKTKEQTWRGESIAFSSFICFSIVKCTNVNFRIAEPALNKALFKTFFKI